MTKHKLTYMIERLNYALDHIETDIKLPVNHRQDRRAKLRQLKRIKGTLEDCQDMIRESIQGRENGI